MQRPLIDYINQFIHLNEEEIQAISTQILVKNYAAGDLLLNKAQQLKSAVFLVLPGMFCDTFCIFFHQLVFPQLSIQQAIVLGAICLFY